MAGWSLEFSREAEEDLARLDRPVRRRIIDKLDWLTEHFDTVVPVVLSYEFKNFYKLRVGDWRIIYAVKWQEHAIVVHYIDRRDKAYKL
ncbi:MAG: type II toxin-antitoxin system RelE/ParE family toxin [Candidatus Liptonbacteria bacterium]|nr:type II toxin-antitoxin system RelE/ParE family toxin [Candidatus Liptonbacteria bacterium]